MAPRPRLLDGALVAGATVLALLAAQADAGEVEPWQVAADLLVGVAFLIAGRVSPVASGSRALFMAVGVTWLLGSFVPDARLSHQPILAVALVTFPAGRPRSVGQLLVVAMAVVALVIEPMGRGMTVAMFGAVTVVSVFGPRADRGARLAAAGGAALIAGVLYGSWHVARYAPASHDPVVALSVYEAALLVVAATVVLAGRAERARRARLVDRFLSDERLVGIEGVEALLGEALGDPSVRVRRPPTEPGRPPGRRWLVIADGEIPLAVVDHGSDVLHDPATAGAVSSAVRLALTNLDLQRELDDQLSAIEAARRRLLAAGDRQRESVAGRLRVGVLEPLHCVIGELRSLATSISEPEASEALAVVVDELTAASVEIADHVAGVPAQLGGGRLVAALRALAGRLPMPVEIDAPEGWSATPEAETALFYVCSEALTNTMKHSRAARAAVVLRRSGSRVDVAVSDDGSGGADTEGSGLVGLADRLAARGGRLRVESPPGAGTTVTATLVG